MGLLDDVMRRAGGGGGIADLVKNNPAIVTAVLSLLSSKKGTIGPADGLGGLISAFQNKGLGDTISSWISTGPNQAVTPQQMSDALGPDILSQFSRQAGIPQGEAGSTLASLLPGLIDGLTPEGQVPATASLEGSLGSLMRDLGLN